MNRKGLVLSNFPRHSTIMMPFAEGDPSPDCLLNGSEIGPNDAKMKTVEGAASENQHTARFSELVLADQTSGEQNLDLERNSGKQERPRRRYIIFPELPSGEPGPPPDGGMTAWLQVLAGHLMCFITWGFITSFGVFQSYYEQTLGLEPSDVSWIGRIQIFKLLLLGTFSGKASDAGLVHEAVFAGTTFIVLGLFMTSLSMQYYQLFLSQGICVGFGMGILYMPGLSVSSSYFKAKKPFAVAIIASGAGSGGLVYPAMVQQLLPRAGRSSVLRRIVQVIALIQDKFWVDTPLHGFRYA